MEIHLQELNRVLRQEMSRFNPGALFTRFSITLCCLVDRGLLLLDTLLLSNPCLRCLNLRLLRLACSDNHRTFLFWICYNWNLPYILTQRQIQNNANIKIDNIPNRMIKQNNKSFKYNFIAKLFIERRMPWKIAHQSYSFNLEWWILREYKSMSRLQYLFSYFRLRNNPLILLCGNIIIQNIRQTWDCI